MNVYMDIGYITQIAFHTFIHKNSKLTIHPFSNYLMPTRRKANKNVCKIYENHSQTWFDKPVDISDEARHHTSYRRACNFILALLTLNVQGPHYLGLTRSISWLLMHADINSHDIDFVVWVGSCLFWGRISTTCIVLMWRNDTKC